MATPQGGLDGSDADGDASPEASLTEPLGRSAAAGTLWLTGQKWVARLSGFVTIAILTRLLAPADFGIVAAASTVTPFVLLLADLGLSTYIVQAARVEDRLLSTGFWFSVSAGAILALFFVAAAPFIADAFNLPGATPVLRVMSIPVLLVVLASVPSALMRRRMQFKTLALQSTVATFAAQVVAIVLAYRGAGVWALVAQLTVSQAVVCVLVWWSTRWRPQFLFSRDQLSTQVRFGGKVVAVDLVATVRSTAEAAIISNVLGASALGYLSIAQRLVMVANDLSAAALVPVSTVVFAKVRDTPARLQMGYLKALRVGYAAVSPLLTFVAIGAPLIVPLVFGDNWSPSIPVTQALALASILVLGAMIDHGLHYGVGRPGRWLTYAVVIDGLTLATTAVLAPHGLTAVAVGFVFVALIATLARWVLVATLIDLRMRHLAGVFARSMICVVGSGVVGVLARDASTNLPPMVSLVLTGGGVLVAHFVLVRLASPRVLTEIADILPLPQAMARWLHSDLA